jgi:hypothetical protein
MMAIYEHATKFASQPVVDWDPAQSNPDATTYRISLSYDAAEQGEHWLDRFATFLDTVATNTVAGLVIGAWEDMFEADGASAAIVEALVVAHDRLPNLRAIFFGDIISEECEISWIQQTDISPLFAAYPNLEHFCVRGSSGLQLGALHHSNMKSLVIQSGGLDAGIVRAVVNAELPNLEHLELWLGTESYGANTTVADLEPLLSGARFPRLSYLGLRDSDIADQIAAALAQAPILERIHTLDLSLGTLGDEGAAALVANPAIAKLARLDIHHHYCSNEMVARLARLGIDVDTSGQEQPDKYDGEFHRYVAVGE